MIENPGDHRESLAIRLFDITADIEVENQSTVIIGKRQADFDLSFDTSDGGIAKTGNRLRMNGDVNGDGYNMKLLSKSGRNTVNKSGLGEIRTWRITP
ncbi:hypothetical protein ACFLZ8_03810 [Planctomycetota bacterium]